MKEKRGKERNCTVAVFMQINIIHELVQGELRKKASEEMIDV